MKAFFSKKIIIFSLLLMLAGGFFYFITGVLAAAPPDVGISYGAEIGLPATDIRLIIARIIRAALGFLGILAVSLMLYAGFVWMTAGGDDEKVGTAKKIMINSVIGLAIIFSAYSIVSFVMSKLLEATTNVPAHCSNQVLDEDESGVDCGGSCRACSGVGDGYASGGGFYVSSLPAGGQLCLRNVHPMLVFSRDVDIATLNIDSNAVIIKEQDGTRVPGTWIHGIKNSIAVFNPVGSCAPEAQDRNDCLDADTDYLLKFENLSAIKSIAGLGSTAQSLIGCRNETTGRIALENCNGVAFTTAGRVDTESPIIRFLSPPAGSASQAGAPVTVRLHWQDDLGIQNLALYEGDELIGSNNFTGCQASGDVDMVWPTAGLEDGPYTLISAVADWAGENGIDQRTFILRPEHCGDGIINEGETDVDCGTTECGACALAICTDNSQCAGGFCDGGVCLNRLTVTGFSPTVGAVGNYVTVFGRYFGEIQDRGGVYFAAVPNPIPDNPAHWVRGILVRCQGAANFNWTNRQIVVQVPQGAVGGPIKVVKGDLSFFDTTSDVWGPALSDFQINNISRPGLCAIVPSTGQLDARVVLLGDRFGSLMTNVADKVWFGDRQAVVSLNNWTDSSIITNVPFLDTGTYRVRVANDGIESNSLEFNVNGDVSAETPQIFRISPDAGGKGEYVTIYGRNFGNSTGLVYFKTAPDAAALMGDFNFPAACARGVWQDDKIVVKFPTGAGGQVGSSYYVQVVNTRSGNRVSPLDSNIRFNLTVADPRPGICNISPVSAPIPYPTAASAVVITGEYFGNNTDNINVYFWADGAAASSLSGRVLAIKNNNFVINRDGTNISLRPPDGTKTGQVVVSRVGESVFSNPTWFEVLDCRAEAAGKPANTCSNQAANQTKCCVATGTCIGANQLCIGETRSTGYVWRFSTQQIPLAPRVVERCNGVSVIPSPSPSIFNSGDDANRACMTSVAMVEFSALMDQATVESNLLVNRCDSIQDNTCINPLAVGLTADSFTLKSASVNSEYLAIQPLLGESTKWLANTYYQVALLSGLRSNGASSMPLASDRPCAVPGSVYCYSFKTSAQDCRLGQVLVTPASFRTGILENIIKFRAPGRSDVPLVFRGWGMGDQKCIAMDLTDYSWEWQANNRGGLEYTSVNGTANSATAGALINTVGDPALVNPPKDTVYVEAIVTKPATTINSAESKTGRSSLVIDLSKPTVVDRWPNCLEACTNAEVGVRFNTTMSNSERLRTALGIDDKPLSDQSVRLYKCLDENCRAIVLVDGVEPAFASDRSTLILDQDGLLPNTLYKVVISAPTTTPAIPQLGTGPNLSNPAAFGAPFDESYSWRFRTKATVCVISEVNVNPALYNALSVLDRTLFSATAMSSPDSCNALGQKLNASSIGWNWTAEDAVEANGAGTVAGLAQFAWRGHNKNCTTGCVRQGSTLPQPDTVLTIPICGNGKIEAGEDCDSPSSSARCSLNCIYTGNIGTACGNGTLDRDDAYAVNGYGEECDPAEGNTKDGCTIDCRRAGSAMETTAAQVSASICGNGAVGNSEDCDLGISFGNTFPVNSAFGCSASCLHLGSLLSNQWCAEHLSDRGGFTTEEYKNACDNAISQCGNGLAEPSEDPGCDLGVGQVNPNCNLFCLLKIGDAEEDIQYNSCADGETAKQGCNTVFKKHLGSSLLYNTPSVCGDGEVGMGEDAYCENASFFDVGNSITQAASNGIFINNPWALVMGIGTGVVDQTIAPPAQRSIITASTNQNSGGQARTGDGEFRIVCGFNRDADCNAQGGNSNGVGYDTCCYARPVIANRMPVDNAVNICPNTAIEAEFSDDLDARSVPGSFILAKRINANVNCTAGDVDVTGLLVSPGEVTYGKPSWLGKIWFYTVRFIKDLLGNAVAADDEFKWCANPNWGLAELSENNKKILRIQLAQPLAIDATYAVIVRDGLKNIQGVSVGLATNGKAINWRFHTAGDVCQVASVSVVPSSYGFTRAYTTSTFFANARSLSGANLQPIAGYYDWDYLWGPPNEIVAFAATTTDNSDNNIGSRNRNGELDIRAAARITADRYSATVGEMTNGNSHILVSLCENNWPPLNVSLDTNDDGVMDGPFLIAPYEDKLGSRDGFDLNSNAFDWSLLPRADRGAYFNFSSYYCADNGGAGVADDLPYLRPAVQTSATVFNQKGFCSGTNQSCDSDRDCVINSEQLTCQKNVIMKRFILTNDKNSDAIGITVFENPNHLTPSEWYTRDRSSGGQGFAGETQSLKIDGYDAVTDGNNIYVDALNLTALVGGKYNIYSNIYLFSVNADARPETRRVFDAMMANLKFNINLSNDGFCGASVNSAGMDNRCSTDMDCAAGTFCVAQKDKIKRNYQRLRDASAIEDILDNYATNHSGSFPALTEGTFLSGQAVSTWPSWTSAFSNTLGRTLPTDPINRLGLAGTCTPSANVFCLTDSDCLNRTGDSAEKCTLHDINTGWSDADRRFSFACSAQSLAYRYIANQSGYDFRLRMERPFDSANNTAILNWAGPTGFVGALLKNTSRFHLDEEYGICLQGNPPEISTLQQGRCGDGRINLLQNSSPPVMEECDPPGSEQFGSCVNDSVSVSVCNNSCLLVPARPPSVPCSDLSRCDNSIVEAGEQCDEGGALNGQPGHCADDCQGYSVATCGNDTLDTGELCDWSVIGSGMSLISSYYPPEDPGTCASNSARSCFADSDCPGISRGCYNQLGASVGTDCQNDSDCVVKKCSISGDNCDNNADCNAQVSLSNSSRAVGVTLGNVPASCSAVAPRSCADLGLSNGSAKDCAGVAGKFCCQGIKSANCVLAGSGPEGATCTFNFPADVPFVLSGCASSGNGNFVCLASGSMDFSRGRGRAGCRSFNIALNNLSLKVSSPAQTCQSVQNTCRLDPEACQFPAADLFANAPFNIIKDSANNVRYGVKRNDSCNWDCKSRGPYCGDGLVEKNYGEQCEGDQTCMIDGVVGKKICRSNICRAASSAVSWWRFETNINHLALADSSSTAHNISSCVGHCPISVAGQFGAAFKFDGSDEYLEVSNRDNLMDLDSFSVEAWIKPNTLSTDYQRILEKGGWQNGGGYGLEYGDPRHPGDVRFLVYDAIADNPALVFSQPITVGEWSHVVGVYVDKKMKLYINGQLQSVTMHNKSEGGTFSEKVIAPSTRPLIIGAANKAETNGTHLNVFNGSIDEVAYYDYAMSASEVSSHYNSADGWYCQLPRGAEALAVLPTSCGDSIQDPSEACDNGPNNGIACAPSYSNFCTYCSNDCSSRITVEPLQRCGDGIIQANETCDRLATASSVWVSSTVPAVFRNNDISAANNGYLGETCEQQINSAVNPRISQMCFIGIGGCPSRSYKKGNYDCLNNCSNFTGTSCISCGINMNGSEVSGNIMNVLDPRNDILGSSQVRKLHLFYIESLAGLLPGNWLGNTVATTTLTFPYSDYTLMTWQNDQDPPSNNQVPAKINNDALCSASDGQHYILSINEDTNPLHGRDWTVPVQPVVGQNDLILSPVIDAQNAKEKDNIRVVLKWRGAGDFSIGFLPDGFLPANLQDSNLNPVITAPYYDAVPDILPFYALLPIAPSQDVGQVRLPIVWYHDYGRINDSGWQEKSFSINTGQIYDPKDRNYRDNNRVYGFYVKADRIQTYRNNTPVIVEVYFPESYDDLQTNHFGNIIPDFVFNLRLSASSANQLASVWHVFNIFGDKVPGFENLSVFQRVKYAISHIDGTNDYLEERHGKIVTSLEQMAL